MILPTIVFTAATLEELLTNETMKNERPLKEKLDKEINPNTFK